MGRRNKSGDDTKGKDGNGSLHPAKAYLQTLDATFQLLARHPGMGRAIDDIREGYFKFPAASHIVIFRVKEGQVEIVRILRKNSDMERQLRERS